jgi:hypothetical protein
MMNAINALLEHLSLGVTNVIVAVIAMIAAVVAAVYSRRAVRQFAESRTPNVEAEVLEIYDERSVTPRSQSHRLQWKNTGLRPASSVKTFAFLFRPDGTAFTPAPVIFSLDDVVLPPGKTREMRVRTEWDETTGLHIILATEYYDAHLNKRLEGIRVLTGNSNGGAAKDDPRTETLRMLNDNLAPLLKTYGFGPNLLKAS